MGHQADYQRIDAALDEALALPERQRAEYVRRFGREHPELAAQLKQLLAVADEPGPLDDAAEFFAVVGESPEVEETDLRFGPYAILETLGEGGMGRVYRARRADGEFEGEVAIKVIRRGATDERLAERFRRERDILAAVDHPGIARLRDAGTAPDGAPFLVMDYVAGQSVLEYADANALPVDARIDLLLEVCEAVAHAHDRLIVHRDLKPSNILVNDEGRAVLLDFGIAKVLGDDGSPGDHTRPHERIFTPRWASPEQLHGEFVGPGTDVYALGLLLHNLVAGRHPQPAQPGSDSGLARSKDISVSVAQARATTPRVLRRRIRGDLRAITERALAREPAARYRSVRQLASDLQAHRAGMPVSARVGSWYRASRFVARNLALVSLGGVLVGLLVAYAVTVGYQRAALERERDRVTVEARRAEASVVFLDRMLLQGSPDAGVSDQITVLSLLRRAEARLDPGAPATAELLLLTARAYASLGQHEAARGAAETALPLAEQRFGPTDERTLEALRVIALANANLLALPEARNAAEDLLRRALAGQGLWSRGAAQGFLTAAEAIDDVDHRRAALRYAAAGLAFLVAEGPLSPGLSDALVGLGFCLRAPPGLGAAVIRLGLATQRRRLGEMDLRVADTLHKLAMSQHDPGQKVQSLRRALAIEEHTAGPAHVRVANTLNDLGLVLEAEDPAESVQVLRRALEVATKIYAPTHPRAVTAVINLGAVLRDQGRAAEAATLMTPVYDALAEGAPTRGVLAYHLGLLRRGEGDEAAAAGLLRVAFDEIVAGDYPVERVAVVARVLGDVWLSQGEAARADEAWSRGIEALRGRNAAPALIAPLRARRDALPAAFEER